MDFGDFDRAVKDNRGDLPITFSFHLDRVSEQSFFFNVEDDDEWEEEGDDVFEDVSLDVSIKKTDVGTRISLICIREGSNNASFKISVKPDGEVSCIEIDEVNVTEMLGEWKIFVSQNTLFPAVRISPAGEANQSRGLSTRADWAANPLRRAIGDLISPSLDKRVKKASLGQLVALLTSLNQISVAGVSTLESRSSNRSWKKLVKNISTNNADNLFNKLRPLLLLNMLPRIVNPTSDELTSISKSVLYIGPARAKSDRYYRYQDLSVSEIDPNGDNFPMFLNSLSDQQITQFSKWVNSLFGYGVSVGRESGHITINLVYEKSTVNIVDTGYGISQILPVLGQLWWAINRPSVSPRRNNRIQLLAIEQPELHLHPAHQALLAEAFINARNQVDLTVGSKQVPLPYLVIETHSETLVNHLGALVEKKKIAPDDIQVVVFDQDHEDQSATNARLAVFDDDGYLVNWPYAFFNPEPV